MSDATYAGGLPQAGWYPDPEVPGQARWWDGHRWYPSQRLLVRPSVARGWGTAVVVLLGMTVALNVIRLVGELLLSPGPGTFDGAMDGSLVVTYIVFSTVVGMVSFPVLIATVVVWCFWQVRVLSIVGATGIRRRPGWHVAAWLIPVCNLVVPLWNMQGLWRSAGLRGQGLLGLWWLSILTYCALVLGSSWLVDGRDLAYRWASAADAAAIVAGGVFAILVVRRLTAAADASVTAGASIGT